MAQGEGERLDGREYEGRLENNFLSCYQVNRFCLTTVTHETPSASR
jgi:hypothetical protein